ncbi:MAG: hypothetical protein J6W79_00535 [Alphaproteobacteria bacterium]|nr:hypothetical protein [Alphaproteobacteria bacterium]
MPTKTTKKTVTKKAPAKKPAKKLATAAPVAKKPISAVEIPLPDPYCHCTKHKRNIILTCVSTGCLVVGFLISQLFFCGCCCKKHAPKIQFVNGCADVSSIKCPKMLEKLPAIDADHNGCITKAELHAAKKMMRHNREPKPATEPAVVDAIAPVME